MFLSDITENLNWEILTENLVTFKRWDEVKDDKFSYYVGSLKIQFIRGRGWGHKKLKYRSQLPNKGGPWQKRGAVGVFLRKMGVIP